MALLATAFFFGIFCPEGASGAPETGQDAFSRLVFGLQPPTDRDAQRAADLAIELLEAGRAGEAAPLVAERLAAPTDALDSAGRSLKRRVLDATLRLDPAGRRALAAVLDGEFRRRLATATSIDKLRPLVAECPAELFGPDALLALARAEEDRGAYAAAARACRAALAAAQSGRDAAAVEECTTRLAANELRLGRGAGESAGDSALRDAIRPAVPFDQSPAAWVGAGGDARRLAHGGGPPPNAWPAWRAELPAERSPSGASEPGLIAVGDTVVTMVAESTAADGIVDDGLVGLDAATGKRRWRRAAALERRGLSSDGRLVFAIKAARPDADADDPLGFFGELDAGVTPNTLAAFDLATAGKLRWETALSAAAGEDSAAGAFLGAPAADQGRLYAMAEVDQAICLVELDAASGRVVWTQPLVRVQAGSRFRRAPATASPTVAAGLVYCPTGRGGLACVDPLARRLVWVRFQGIDRDAATPARSLGWGAFGTEGGVAAPDAWEHTRAIEADGRVIVVSPAAATLEAFDAATGDSLWRRKHPAGRRLGTVTEGLVITVEAARVLARRVTDGTRRWSATLPEGDAPAGEGLLLDGVFATPLVSGGLALVDVAAVGSVAPVEVVALGAGPLEPSAGMGDLAWLPGMVFVRSASALACYPQAARMPSEVDGAIAALLRGPDAGATAALRAAALGGDRRAADALAAALVRWPDDDDPAAVAAELRGLGAGPPIEAHAGVIAVEAALAAGDPRTAAAELVGLAGSSAGRVLLRPDASRSITAAGAAVAAVAESSPELRAAVLRAVQQNPAEDPLAAASVDAALAGLGENSPSRAPEPTPRQPAADRSPDWTLRRVEARVAAEERSAAFVGRDTRPRPDQAEGSRPLPVFDAGGGPTRIARWRVETRSGGQTLAGEDAHGDPVFVEPLPGDLAPADPIRGPLQQTVDPIRWGDWLVLRLDAGTAVFRLSGPASGLAWATIDPIDPLGDGAAAPESPIAVGPWGVVTRGGESLRCRDLATGALRWANELGASHLPRGRAAAVGDSLWFLEQSGECSRASVWDGRVTAAPRGPRGRTWLGVYGEGLLLASGRTVGGEELSLVRPADAAAPLWRREVAPTDRAAVCGELLVVLTEGLDLTVVDLARREQRFTVPLPRGTSEAVVQGVRARRLGGDRLLVEVDRSNPMVDRAAGVSAVGDGTLLSGELHCLDARTGRSLWQRPAEVEALGVLDAPAEDFPVVLLARRLAPESAEPNAEATLALVALDPATGACVYANHAIPAGSDAAAAPPVRTQREWGPTERVTVRLGDGVVTLEPTGPPAAPRPPMLARVEDPYATRTRDARDVERGIDRFLQSLFDDD